MKDYFLQTPIIKIRWMLILLRDSFHRLKNLVGFGDTTFSSKTLRIIRLLRPLRTLKFVPGMRTVVSTIAKAVETSVSIMLVTIMLIFVCAAFAYIYWAKTLVYRCMDVEVRWLSGLPWQVYYIKNQIVCCLLFSTFADWNFPHVDHFGWFQLHGSRFGYLQWEHTRQARSLSQWL